MNEVPCSELTSEVRLSEWSHLIGLFIKQFSWICWVTEVQAMSLKQRSPFT